MSGVRSKSLESARAMGIIVPIHLPELDPPKFRTVDQTVDRLFCLTASAAVAYGFPADKALKWLEQEQLSQALEVPERTFLNGTGNPTGFQWQVEGLFVLLWALSVYGQFNFLEPCPDDLVHRLPDLKVMQGTSGFRADAVLRAQSELIQYADLAYCLHWAARDAQPNDRIATAGLETAIVEERRRALDWLIGEDDWYELSLDT